MNKTAAALLCALIITTPAASMAQSAALAVGGAQQPILRAGTPIVMRNGAELTTKGKALRVGQRVPLEVAEDLRLNGQVVIPAGSPGMGEITTVRNKGMWGKSGGLTGRVLYVRVGDRQIRLSGTFDDKGVTGTAAVVGAVLLIPVVGFFTTGTSATIPAGAAIPAFLDEDVPVTFAAGTPVSAPIQAGAAASPAVASTPAGLIKTASSPN